MNRIIRPGLCAFVLWIATALILAGGDPGIAHQGAEIPVRFAESGGVHRTPETVARGPNRDKPLPKLEHLTAYGCSVELMVPEQNHWHAYVWAEHGEGKRDWKVLYSQHCGKSARKKCLDDCDAWMRQIEKLNLRSSR